MPSLEQISKVRCFGGYQYRFKHHAQTTGCDMVFAVYLPDGVEYDATFIQDRESSKKLPAIYWLSGLTCTDENFVQKAGAQQWANQHRVALIAPDTSPRGDTVPDDEHAAYDFGLGAGFYLNATQSPWSQHYQMYDYIVHELPSLVESQLPISDKKSIMGHSMGGHGALTIALKNPGVYQSVSAFAPICHPSACSWGQKAFGLYLGEYQDVWAEYDTCKLVLSGGSKQPLFVDQGTADSFLEEQLRPQDLVAACESANHPLDIKYRTGYDHSYFYIASFVAEHIAYHAEHLVENRR